MKEYKNTKKQNEPNLGKHGGLPLLRTPNNELRTFLSKRTHFLLEAGSWKLLYQNMYTCIPAYLHTCFGNIGKGDLSFSNVWFWGIMVG